MWKVKQARVLAVGALIGAFGFGSQIAFAEDTNCAGEDIVLVKDFVENAEITLAEAIEKAELQCNGRAIRAEAIDEDEHAARPGGVKAAHYHVCCLAQGKITNLFVDSRSGIVLATHESEDLPPGFRTFRLTSTGEPTTPMTTKVITTGFRVQKASDLIGKNVENNRGEKLGEVQDLAIDPDRGRVAYAVVSFGGFLGMGEKWFAVPIGALTLPDHAKHFVLVVEKDRLKNATGFDKDRWPTMADSTWGTGIHEFYGQPPYWLDDGGSTPRNLRIQKASDIIGLPVQNDRGEKLGDIKDLVIDPDRGRVTYAVLTFGGFLGMGDKLFAIPGGVIQMPGTASYVVLNVDKDRLKNATGFDQNNWPNLADPTFSVTTYEYYGQKPYWKEDKTGKTRP